jgi:hypothetical protein
MKDLFGLDITEGALVNILERFAAASAAIRDRLLSCSVICSDETGLRVGKRSRLTHELNYNVIDSARGVVMLAHNARDVQVGERIVHALVPRRRSETSLLRRSASSPPATLLSSLRGRA